VERSGETLFLPGYRPAQQRGGQFATEPPARAKNFLDSLLTQLAAEASEAAADQGAFWEMHDLLFAHQDALRPSDLISYAEQLGLDVERFTNDLREQAGAARVADDVDSADLSGVSGTPTFFINGRRHYGAYDIGTLSAAVRAAGARATLTTSG
jgi:protein-disulfide isomerase